ncbi:hypothetical protein BDQ12DRAFT_722250 [Crucibulum laeve]|uniref:Uncharacterized protein n=1 Tax=Crucibulum laeve TaxID=68775 RepID=A0A5C3M3G7_9AGAR|nr:hypothetical protein BDQ12DRAFT_722250 [Crucibulum laeve]
MYYSAEAEVVFRHAEKCDEDYDEWVMSLKSYDSAGSLSPSASTTNTLGPTSGMELTDGTAQSQASASCECPLAKTPPPMPRSVQKLHESWLEYIDSRKGEWNVLLTLAGFFIASSPAMFQIPGAVEDPLICCFTSLAVCRAVSGLLCGPIFHIQFRNKHTMNVHYARLWIQEASRTRLSILWSPWIMISLPAVFTIWSIVLFMCAMFSFVWRAAAEADITDDAVLSRNLNSTAVFGLRGAITGLFVIDMACVLLSAWTMRRYKHRCLDISS